MNDEDDDDVVNDHHHHHLVALFGKWIEWKQNSEIFQLMMWFRLNWMSCCWCEREYISWMEFCVMCLCEKNIRIPNVYLCFYEALIIPMPSKILTETLIIHFSWLVTAHTATEFGVLLRRGNEIALLACILIFFVGKCNSNYKFKRLKSLSFAIRPHR